MKNRWNKTLSLFLLLIMGSFASLSVLAASTPVGNLPFTGDNAKIGLVIGAMGLALVVIVVISVISRRKK